MGSGSSKAVDGSDDIVDCSWDGSYKLITLALLALVVEVVTISEIFVLKVTFELSLV